MAEESEAGLQERFTCSIRLSEEALKMAENVRGAWVDVGRDPSLLTRSSVTKEASRSMRKDCQGWLKRWR